MKFVEFDNLCYSTLVLLDLAPWYSSGDLAKHLNNWVQVPVLSGNLSYQKGEQEYQ